jgi:hypothetical protein
VGASDDGAAQRGSGPAVYSFRLEEMVPTDHLTRDIAAVLDLSWGHAELGIGRPGAHDPDAHDRIGLRDPLGARALEAQNTPIATRPRASKAVRRAIIGYTATSCPQWLQDRRGNITFAYESSERS